MHHNNVTLVTLSPHFGVFRIFIINNKCMHYMLCICMALYTPLKCWGWCDFFVVFKTHAYGCIYLMTNTVKH